MYSWREHKRTRLFGWWWYIREIIWKISIQFPFINMNVNGCNVRPAATSNRWINDALERMQHLHVGRGRTPVTDLFNKLHKFVHNPSRQTILQLSLEIGNYSLSSNVRIINKCYISFFFVCNLRENGKIIEI